MRKAEREYCSQKIHSPNWRVWTAKYDNNAIATVDRINMSATSNSYLGNYCDYCDVLLITSKGGDVPKDNNVVCKGLPNRLSPNQRLILRKHYANMTAESSKQ